MVGTQTEVLDRASEQWRRLAENFQQQFKEAA
jgi:hypothetical protein